MDIKYLLSQYSSSLHFYIEIAKMLVNYFSNSFDDDYNNENLLEIYIVISVFTKLFVASC